MSPAFSSANLKNMSQSLERSMNLLLNNFEKLSKEDSVNIKPYLEALSLDLILNTIFGANVDSANDPNNPIVENSRKVFGGDLSIPQLIALASPLMAKIFGFSALNPKATDIMAEISLKIINDRKINNSKKHDMIQYLIDAENNDINESNKSKFQKISMCCIKQ